MRRARTTVARIATLGFGPALSEIRLACAWRRLIHELFDPYRPELHYMRGRGPKWYAKHGITKSC